MNSKFSIDVPSDPALAYKHGWFDAIDSAIRSLTKHRDIEYKESDGKGCAVLGYDRAIEVLSNQKDIQSALAKIKDQE